MGRQCSRPACSDHAVVTLTYSHAQALVWLDDLAAERDPHAYDLCEQHGARLNPPRGWQVRDRRSIASFLIAV